MKQFTLLGLAVLCTAVSFAQSDSSGKQMSLKEVVISQDSKDDATNAFNFYRSGKITSTEEILNRIEGVNLIQRGAFGMEPVMRAYSAGQINVTINGMKMYGACTDKMDPVTVYIEPGNLNSLQVNQGAGGSLMGSTVGGGMNMQMKEAGFSCHRILQLRAYSQYSSVNNGWQHGFLFNTNSTRSSIRMNATYRKADDYLAGGGATIAHSGYEKLNFNTGLAFKLSSRHTLLADYIGDWGRNMGYPALTMDVLRADANIVSLTHRFEQEHAFLSKLESKIYFNAIHHHMDDSHRPETPMHMDMPGWSKTAGFYSQADMLLKKNRLTLRADGHQAFTKADMTMYPVGSKPMYLQTLPGNELSNMGLALSDYFQINSSTAVGATLRFDYYLLHVSDTFGMLQWEGMGVDLSYDRDYFLSNYALFAEKNLGKLAGRFSVSYGQRLPTANERIGFYLYNRLDGYDYLGNADLLPEQALQTEFKLAYTEERYQVSFNLFYHQISDYIYAHIVSGYSPMTYGAKGVKTCENIASATLTGVEASWSWRFADHWNFVGNERFTYANLSNGKPMQQVPPLKLINTLRYQKAALQFQAEHTWAAAQNRINADYGEVATAAWQVVNLRGAYMFKWKKTGIQLTAAIENVFDVNFREHLDWSGIPRPGRNLVAGLCLFLN